MRALADVGATHVRDFHDPTARVFLNDKWKSRLAKVDEQVKNNRETIGLGFARASADLMALRTKTIDAAVRDAIARGTSQLVILGAGLDGRAWRMSELAGSRVFEIDHPATQAMKRAHLDALPKVDADVTFVPIDFERQSLSDALAGAGHDASRPTCWIWEGVVMYLTPDAMRATLADVSSRSAPGSTLVINYHTSMRRGLFGLYLRLIGEPVRSAWSPAQMAGELAHGGFEVSEDTGVTEWAQRYATGQVEMRAGRVMRVAVADRASVHAARDR